MREWNIRKITVGGRITLPELLPYVGKYFVYTVERRGEREFVIHMVIIDLGDKGIDSNA